jgi:hypothetical protein
MGRSHSGNYDRLKAKLAGKVRALGIVPEGTSVVFERVHGSPAKCRVINGITKEELGIVSRYSVGELFDDELTFTTDAAGIHWLSPKEE